MRRQKSIRVGGPGDDAFSVGGIDGTLIAEGLGILGHSPSEVSE